jgi:hemolysin activation/secretion protein
MLQYFEFRGPKGQLVGQTRAEFHRPCVVFRRAILRFAAPALLMLATAPTFAQQVAPSQVTPSTLRPQAQPSAGIALPASEGLSPPQGAEKLSVKVGRIDVEGTFPELAAATAAITESIRGKTLSVSQIYQAANAIEQAYAAAGYILARVVVPPQKLVDNGPLHLVIVDGFIESVDVKGVPERQRAVVAARMASVVGLHHVTLPAIERRLLIVADIPGLVLRSTLARGSTPGGTLLVLEATQNYVTGSAGFDDHLPSSLGTWALNSSFALNSVFGFGEQIYASATSSYQLGKSFDGKSPIRVLGGGFVLPVGTDGFTLNPEYTNSTTLPTTVAGAPPSRGIFERFAIRAAYPLIRTRAETLNLQATYEFDEEHLTPIGFDTVLYQDRYQVTRWQAAYSRVLAWAATAQASGTFSLGVTGRTPAAAAAAGIPLSRTGVSPEFSKFDLDLHYAQLLPADFQLALIGHGQTSFDKPLMLAEQFSLDGPDALSGFASGTFSVDQGMTGRAELSHPFPVDPNIVPAIVSPYIFGAAGRGFVEMPTAVERPTIDAESFGVGLRTNATSAPPFGGAFSFELARRLSDDPGYRQGYRANVAFSLSF